MESKQEVNFASDQSGKHQANNRSENSNGSDNELLTLNYSRTRWSFKTNKYSKSSNQPSIGTFNPSHSSKKLFMKSSMPAISQIGHSETITGKIVWTLVLVTVILGYVFHVINFTNYYMEFPVMVNLKVDTLHELDFPAITICNRNRMKKVFEACLYDSGSLFDCYEIKLYGGYANEALYSKSGTPMVMSDRNIHFSGEKVNNLTSVQKFLIAYFSTNEEFRTKVSMHPSEFIYSCAFHGKTCSWKDFDTTLNYRYGLCYTFNQRHTDSLLLTGQAGVEGGLQLTLNFDVNMYLDHTPVVGGRVIIHHPTEIPEIEEEGISVSPGTETSIALRQELTKRLPDPYKDQCRDYSSEKQPSSQKECTKSCIQKFSHDMCGCADPTLRSFNLKLCDMTNKTQMQCLNQALMNLSMNSSVCNCPLSCLSVAYHELLSYSKFPSREFYFSSRERRSTEDVGYQIGKRNFVKVNVFYLNFERKTLEQRPVFEDSELFSNLGGELDLWLGVSLFALFELIEIIIHFCLYVFEYVQNRYEKTFVSVIS